MTNHESHPPHNPYAPPQTVPPAGSPAGVPYAAYPRQRPFIPGGTLGRVTQGFHWVFFGMALLGLFVGLAGLLGADEATFALLGLGAFARLFTLVLAPLFCVWFYRVYANLLVLGRRKNQLATWWAPASFFVPIVNAIFPWQIAWEVWEYSKPPPPPSHLEAADRSPKTFSSTRLVGLWWLGCVCWFIAGFIYTAVTVELSRHREGFFLFNMALDLVTLLTAAAGALMVREVDRRQRALYHARVAAAQPTPPTSEHPYGAPSPATSPEDQTLSYDPEVRSGFRSLRTTIAAFLLSVVYSRVRSTGPTSVGVGVRGGLC